jgi:NAD(P)-dependent dehydrogenase (short-subunit alcohol dehydrogenase family)
VTGAGGGMGKIPLKVGLTKGRATVLQFIRDGCTRLVISDVNEVTLKETTEMAKHLQEDAQVEAVVGDLSSEEFVEHLFSQTKSVFGRLDYAVNCAGVGGGAGPTAELTFADFKKAQAVNFEGLWLCERAELRMMLEQDVVNG